MRGNSESYQLSVHSRLINSTTKTSLRVVLDVQLRQHTYY